MTYNYPPYGTYPGGANGTNTGLTIVPHSAPLTLTGDMTICCWFRTSKDYTADLAGYMVTKGNYNTETAGQNINYALLVSTDVDPDNVFEFLFETSAGVNKFNVSGVTVNDGQWHHGTGRWNNTTKDSSVFVDGVLSNTINYPGSTPDNNTKDLFIGGHELFPSYVGDVDEICIWNRALSNSEIEDVYNNNVIPSSGLVYHETFGTDAPITSSSIKVFYSGGAANTDPLLSKGGLKSSEEIDYSKLEEIFKSTTKEQDDTGFTDFRGLYVENTSQTRPVSGVKLYVHKETTSLSDQILIGLAPEGKNETMQALGTIETVPDDVDFTQASSPSLGLQVGILLPGESIGFFIERAVNPGTPTLPNNLGQIGIFFSGDNSGVINVPPPSGGDSVTNFKVALTGDMSCASTFTAVLNRIKARNVDLFVALGDNAYSDGSNCWISLINNAGLGGSKSIITFGNHDVDESEDQPETMQNLINAFNLTGTWYGRTFNNTFWLVMNSEDSPEDNPQRDNLESLLQQAANNPGIEWIFVTHHRPIYGPDSDHPNEADVRDVWDPLFDQYGVDAVFTAHNHIAWQSDLIRYDTVSPASPIVVSTGTGSPVTYAYNDGATNHGKMYVSAGWGGRTRDQVESSESWINWSNDSSYGYVFLDFQNNGKKIFMKFYSSSDSLLNQVVLEHL